NYTSDIPSSGVEEFKSLNADGFAIRIVMRRDPHETATASCAGDLSLDALRETLARARRSMINDPHFPGLPDHPRKLAGKAAGAGDLMRTNDAALAAAAWDIIGGAIARFTAKQPLKLARPGLVLGGDLSLIRDRIALANSGFDDLRIDEGAYFNTSVTVLVEALEAKGTATAVGASLAEMRRAAHRVGADAVARALKLRHGERPPAGIYRVVLGPQPVAEILNYMVLPSLTTGAFRAATSAYHGRFGQQVMDPRLSLFDDPLAKSGALNRRITCEGLPARRTELVNAGRLVGLLSNFYETHRLATDEHRGEKLGPGVDRAAAEFPPLNGYRLGESVARRFDAFPRAIGTNVIMHTHGGVGERELLAAVGDGIYIGRVWYTYPINGQRAGDFTCTVSGDSYVIRDGRLAAPLAPNCFRVNANIEQIFAAPLVVGKRSEPALVWGSAEAYYTPVLAADTITLAAVGAKHEMGSSDGIETGRSIG
ncbi:MAG: metallopeptidase TldD-related protein, partial [Candidatus Binataceae bacterium]